MKLLTVDTFKELFPTAKNPEEIVATLNKYKDAYQLNTLNRLAGFLAQCGHESGGFRIFKENLNYSAEGLVKIFKKYFPTIESTVGYARNPEKIANKVYGGRMGNGPETTGDGWRFSGKGAIQLTGRNNYQKFADFKKLPLTATADYLLTVEGAIESALWFWQTNGLNNFCDKDDIVGMTKRINGGTIGLEDRKHHYEKIKKILA